MIIKNFVESKKTFIIAEVGQGHDGSLGIAHSYIDAAADCGVDAIKFQTHIAEEESTEDDIWRVNFSYEDKTRYDYWKRTSFNSSQWVGLAKHANEKGLEFLSSPFSVKACEILKDIGVNIWKIASGECSNLPMLEKIIEYGDEVILSNGLCNYSELLDITKLLKKSNTSFGILQCTSEYPVSPENIFIGKMCEIKERFRCSYGLSDHSGSIYPSLAAAALGANIIEVHITFSKQIFGPDSKSSLDLIQLKNLVEGVRLINSLNTTDKFSDYLTREQKEMKRLFSKSIVAAKNINAGTIITKELLSYKKPGTGIVAWNYKELLGKTLTKNMYVNERFDYKYIK